MVLEVYSSAVGAALAPWGAPLSAGMGCDYAISVNHKLYPRTPKHTEFTAHGYAGFAPIFQADFAAPGHAPAVPVQTLAIFL